MTEEEKKAHAKRLVLEWLDDGPEFAYVYEDEEVPDYFDDHEDIYNEMLSIVDTVAQRLADEED